MDRNKRKQQSTGTKDARSRPTIGAGLINWRQLCYSLPIYYSFVLLIRRRQHYRFSYYLNASSPQKYVCIEQKFGGLNSMDIYSCACLCWWSRLFRAEKERKKRSAAGYILINKNPSLWNRFSFHLHLNLISEIICVPALGCSSPWRQVQLYLWLDRSGWNNQVTINSYYASHIKCWWSQQAFFFE